MKKPRTYQIRGENGADNGTRTRGLNLGKVALYQLSYVRMFFRTRTSKSLETQGTELFTFLEAVKHSSEAQATTIHPQETLTSPSSFSECRPVR